MRRARSALSTADIVLMLRMQSSAGTDYEGLAKGGTGRYYLYPGGQQDRSGYVVMHQSGVDDPGPDLWISAKTGQGIDRLRTRIREAVGAADHAEGSFSARQRHIDALKRAWRHLVTVVNSSSKKAGQANCWLKNSAWRRQRWVKSPANFFLTICWAKFFPVSASENSDISRAYRQLNVECQRAAARDRNRCASGKGS